jgi:two-component system sensor histidine kinase UhpB
VTAKLRPTLLDDLGLLPALRALVADFQRADGVAITLTAPEELPALSPDAEVAIFRAVQEGLSNVVRHAAAETASVSVDRTEAGLVVRVTDDGVGPSRLPPREHMGLAGMRERVAALGGRVRFDRATPRGALLEITLPLGATA